VPHVNGEYGTVLDIKARMCPLVRFTIMLIPAIPVIAKTGAICPRFIIYTPVTMAAVSGDSGYQSSVLADEPVPNPEGMATIPHVSDFLVADASLSSTDESDSDISVDFECIHQLKSDSKPPALESYDRIVFVEMMSSELLSKPYPTWETCCECGVSNM